MSDSSIKNMVMIAAMTAVLCITCPLSIPIGAVPVSLGNFVILIVLYVLGMKKGTLSVLLFLLIGLVGVPVFSGYQGGPGKLMGPTGGYLIGWIPLAIIAGLCIERFVRKPIFAVLGMILATIVLYAIGTAWLAYQTGMSFEAALSAGVIPFIAIDLIKIILASVIGPILHGALVKAGLTTRFRAEAA